jgi:succinate dehydrogenase/fumarate reductase flavoprotein subunit
LGDPDHKPNPCLAPVSRAPFFAIKVYPGDIGTALGISVDANARVSDRDEKPIPGLYAVGNDMHSVMAGEYPSAGITLGPALTFGWLAGMHLGEQARQAAKSLAPEVRATKLQGEASK